MKTMLTYLGVFALGAGVASAVWAKAYGDLRSHHISILETGPMQFDDEANRIGQQIVSDLEGGDTASVLRARAAALGLVQAFVREYHWFKAKQIPVAFEKFQPSYDEARRFIELHGGSDAEQPPAR